MDSQATQHMQGWIWPFGDGEGSWSLLLPGFGYMPLWGGNGNAVSPGCPFPTLIQAVDGCS